MAIRQCPSKRTPSSTTTTGAFTSPKTRAWPLSSTRSVASTFPTSSPFTTTVPARTVAFTTARPLTIRVSVVEISPRNFPLSITVPLNVYFPSISEPSSMRALSWPLRARAACRRGHHIYFCGTDRSFSSTR